MVITILEAHVSSDQVSLLKETYDQAIQKLDAGIVQTFLLRSSSESNLWQILTVWESREALEAMRQTGETPRGVLIFRTAGAEPVLSVFRVLSHAEA